MGATVTALLPTDAGAAAIEALKKRMFKMRCERDLLCFEQMLQPLKKRRCELRRGHEPEGSPLVLCALDTFTVATKDFFHFKMCYSSSRNLS